jgi:hypothetical protein
LKFSKLLLAAASFVVASTVSHAGIILSEGFDNITTLSPGWVQINNSTAGGTIGWFQGDPLSAFPAQSGASNSYIAANFNNAGFGGDVSNWLILPSMLLTNGDTLTFYTRTEVNPLPGDKLQVLVSPTGSTNVGSSTSSTGDYVQLAIVGAGVGGYPQDWTQVVATVTGLSGPTTVRLAFRYSVSNTSLNGDFIGIDSVSVDSALPEPATLLMLSAGIVLIGFKRARMARS